MPFKYACTTGGHFTLALKGKKSWFYVPTDPEHPALPVGPFPTPDQALEAAQHLENEYFR